ncbi:hypothetical protein JAAARDRAFT_199387 [Jaapia argillacea MUCL 33604]|uniref:Mechanosensitive ion channel protein n=1 Tax=Jaapia argillacea MUCL 33604 TaxID=933084 RepID=A0A067P8S1_9AGAM|nr:hypothetical protein JAAARDRAFT_199387 [Jaapia argillacea MUCL 33604]
MAGSPQQSSAVELQNQEHGRNTPRTPGRYSGDVSRASYILLPDSTPYDLEGGPRKFSKRYNYCLDVRLFLFIVPVLGIIWIPGILQLTTWPDAKLWGVGWIWWSSWLTCLWGGWWVALIVAIILPNLFRSTIGLIAVGTQKYTHWMLELKRFNALLAWSLGIWIAFNPLILVHQVDNANARSVSILSIIGNVLCGLSLSSALLLLEKIFVQFIKMNFYQRYYTGEQSQRFEATLTGLYITHFDPLLKGPAQFKSAPKMLFKQALKKFRDAANTTTPVWGDDPSEIVETWMFRPNSPETKEENALNSSDDMLKLARGLFESIANQPVTNKDANENASRAEVEAACSLSEMFISIIFLLVRHPFDVGDRVELPEGSYTVKELLLLHTVFLDSNGIVVQVPNIVLHTKYIQNIRRSPPMSEPFKFDIDFSTSFGQLESLRDKMMAFLKVNSEDFFPIFDLMILETPDKTMCLKVDIKYKSNLQLDSLKAQRRNKWICALVQARSDCEIYGPNGNPNPPPISRYTMIPWETVEGDDLKKAEAEAKDPPKKVMPEGGWRLTAGNVVAADAASDVAVFGDAKDLRPSATHASTEALPGRSTTASSIPSVSSRNSLPPLTTSPSSSTEMPKVSTPKVPIFTRAHR